MPNPYDDINGRSWASTTIYYTFDTDFYTTTHPVLELAVENEIGITSANITKTAYAMMIWSSVANVEFQETTNLNAAQLVILEGDLANEGGVFVTPTGTGAFSYGAVIVDNTFSEPYIYHTYVHEFGHALGLTHPKDGDSDPGNDGTNTNYDRSMTVMSYNQLKINGTDVTYVDPIDSTTKYLYPTSPMVLDIQAIQAKYGANYGYNAENGTAYNITGSPVAKTIWDGAGTGDYITAASYNGGKAEIDLQEGLGHHSKIGDSYIWIAVNPDPVNHADVGIEDAYGTNYSAPSTGLGDDIIGNSKNNKLYGNAGGDTIEGLAGNDTLTGGDGNDTLVGGDGTDTYYFANTDDVDTLTDEGGNLYVQGFLVNDNFTYLYTGEFANGYYGYLGGGISWGWITVDGNNLDFHYGSGGDHFIISGGYSNHTNWGITLNKTITGTSSADTLTNGYEVNTFNPGQGNDIVEWNPTTDNSDIINETATGGGTDKLKITLSGATSTDFDVYANPDQDLIVKHIASGKYMTITNEYDSDGDYRIESIEFADTSTLSLTSNVKWKGTSGADSITATSYDDNISGYDGNDTLVAGTGNDIINGGVGNDIMNGGQGDDIYQWALGDGNDVLTETATGTGSDKIKILTSGLTISDFEVYGYTTGDLVIKHIASGATITIDNHLGTDTDYRLETLEFEDNSTFNLVQTFDYKGTSFAETIDGTSGNDTIYGYGGDDALNGLGGNDTIDGGDGNDSITGGDGTDTIYGGDGDDLLNGSANADVIDGGNGVDRLSLNGATSGATVNLVTGTGSGNIAAGDTYTNIEDVSGTNYVDSITGDGNNNTLWGLDGADVINGGGGNDTIYGGDHNDTIDAGTGADTIDGGTGTDNLTYAASSAGVTVNLTTNTNTGGDAQGDNLSNIENVYGSTYADVITGNSATNFIFGDTGNDTLYGEGGTDTIQGAGGIDTMYGGSGNDTFKFTGIAESSSTSLDSIMDWATGDKIMLTGAGIAANFAGLSVATSGTGVLVSDIDSTFQLYVEGVGSLSSTDFIF